MAPMNIMILMERKAHHDSGDSATTILNMWIYFNLVGNTILLPIVVITFLFSKNAKRHPTLVNLCITWIFSGVFSLLLFYSKQHVGPKPDPSLCVAQASLLYGITPMWAVAVLALFYYMLHTLRGEPSQSKLLRGLPMAAMLSAPYVAQCSFTIAALMVSFRNPTKVRRHGYLPFCVLLHKPMSSAKSIFIALMCIAIIVLEVALAVVIYRNWRGRRCAGVSSELPFPLVARVLVFGIYVTVGMAVNILSMAGQRLAGHLFEATAGTVVFLIFGTQADVFRAWCFWKGSVQNPKTSSWPPKLAPTPRQSHPSSLEAMFRSAKSDKKFPWSDRLSRPPSQPSTRRSTKNFMRLPDDTGEFLTNIPGQSPIGGNAEGEQQFGSRQGHGTIETPQSPKQAKLKELRQGEGRSVPVDGLGELENRRKRRRNDPPRPKGPRKANASNVNTAHVAESLLAKPPAAALR